MNVLKKLKINLQSAEAIDWILISLAFAAVVISYLINLIYVGLTINSDTATEILLGREMWLQKSLFPKDFYYTTELFLIRTPLFVGLWSFVINDIINAYRFAIVTEVILVTLSLIYFLKSLSLGKKSIALGILIFFGVRTYLSAYFIGMGGSSYATMHITFFLIIGYYANKINNKKTLYEKIFRILIPILALNFGLSSIKMFIVIFFPILFVHFIAKFFAKDPISFKNDSIMFEMVLWIIFYFIGYNITLYVILPKGFGPLYFQSNIAHGITYIVSKSIPAALTEFFHVNPIFTLMIPFKIFSLNFINGFLGLIFIIVAILCLLYSLRKCSIIQNKIYFILLFGLFLVLFSLTLFQSSNYLKIRFFIQIYILISLAIASVYEDINYSSLKKGRFFLLFICIFIITNGVYNSLQIGDIENGNISKYASRNFSEIENSFKRHGIKRGYALYWDSSTVTLLTNNRIELVAVKGDMEPNTYMAPYRYYSPEYRDERTAFVRIIQPLNPEIADLPQFKITNYEIFNIALEKEVIYDDSEVSIEIYFYDKNLFTFPVDHDPKSDLLALQLDFFS
jgi:hypothetical protein